MGSPKIPEPKDPPPMAPPPIETAEEVETPEMKKRRDSRKRGVSGLIIRRPSLNTGAGMGGSGLRI